MRALVLLNGAAGTLAGKPTSEQAAEIERLFSKHQASVEVRLVEPADLAEVARRGAEAFDVVVAGGGDGTINSVAAGLVGSPTPMAVLPVGTFNHFAKELAMPLELEPAVEAIVNGRPKEFAVAEANGRLFVSFAAIGFYAEAIRHREAQRRARGRRKALAMVVALWHALSRMPLRHVRVLLPSGSRDRLTPTLAVASNAYQLKTLGLSEDAALDRSRLNVCVARPVSRIGAMGMILRGLVGQLQPVFETLQEETVEVQTRRAREHVVIDGELAVMEMPMRCRRCERPLRVIVPPEQLKEEGPQFFAVRA